MKVVAFALLAALTGCGASMPKTDGPARDEVRGAIYAAEFGCHRALQQCMTGFATLLMKGNVNDAKDVAAVCSEQQDKAAAGFTAALTELDGWGPGASNRIACAMTVVVQAFDALGPPEGEDRDTIADGRSRAQWLASSCR